MSVKRRGWTQAITFSIIFATLGFATQANADAFRFWIGGRGDYFAGTGDVFTQYDAPFGGGLEVGIELMEVTLATELLFMGSGQMLFAADLGVDFFFGESPRFGVGIFTGPILFIFPEGESAAGVDFSLLSDSELQALLDAGGFNSVAEAEAEFNQFAEAEDDLGRLGFGWDIARLRLSGDVPLGPMYVGLSAAVAYHFLISGDNVAAGAKNEAIDAFAEDNSLPTDVVSTIRELVGAEPVDTDNLDGLNWDIALYLRFEL